MDVTSLVAALRSGFLIIGAVAGWLAGMLMLGGGFGLLGKMAAGIFSAFAGGFLFGLAPVSVETGLVGSLFAQGCPVLNPPV